MITPSPGQDAAVSAICKWWRDGGKPPFILTGYAGSGKTTLIPTIIEAIGLEPAQVAFMAPTAKAAMVMSRRLREAGILARAQTIHKSIYRSPLERSKQAHEKEDEYIQKRLAGRASLLFEISTASPVWQAKLIICDEASMVGDDVARDLLLFDVPILAIGDPGQLPPVERSPGFNLLTPGAFLSEIHRQALESPIIRLAHAVREGKHPPIGEYGPGVRIVRPNAIEIPTEVSLMPTVIVGTHRKRWSITGAIRGVLGFEGPLPQAGEKIMCCKNSRLSLEIVNGAEAIMQCDAERAWDDEFAVVIFGRTDEGLPLVPRFGEYTSSFDVDTDWFEDEDEEEDAGDQGLTPDEWDETVGQLRQEYDQGDPLRAYRGLFDEHQQRRRGAVVGNQQLAMYRMKDLEHIDFGWAITCHKSQGSQWDDVVVLDESHVFRDQWRQWLYTATTRAISSLTIVTG